MDANLAVLEDTSRSQNEGVEGKCRQPNGAIRQCLADAVSGPCRNRFKINATLMHLSGSWEPFRSGPDKDHKVTERAVRGSSRARHMDSGSAYLEPTLISSHRRGVRRHWLCTLDLLKSWRLLRAKGFLALRCNVAFCITCSKLRLHKTSFSASKH